MRENTPPTVLLVDDEASILHALRRLLHHLGYQVLCARSGLEALHISAQGGIDLVLSDIQMPGMSGHEVAAALRDQCPVLLMTGNFSQYSAGVLAKPFSGSELKARISEHLQQYHCMRAATAGMAE